MTGTAVLFSDRRLRATMFKKKIKDVYFDKKQRYGSPRIATELQAQGVKICRVTVAKYMKEMGLRSKVQDNNRFKAYA